jgi:hypothetical protein
MDPEWQRAGASTTVCRVACHYPGRQPSRRCSYATERARCRNPADEEGLPNPIDYYSPETSLFPELAVRFAATGKLEAEELYLILDWKAARARTRHLKRLTVGRTFSQATQELARDLCGAIDDAQRLKLLLSPSWSFALPTATAILTVLYPERFTIYDIRVCDALGAFHGLGNRRWSEKTWPEYSRFVAEVRAAVPEGLNLRDADRWLWGHNKQQAIRRELGIA